MEKETEKIVMYCMGCNEGLALEEIEAEYNLCTKCIVKRLILDIINNLQKSNKARV